MITLAFIKIHSFNSLTIDPCICVDMKITNDESDLTKTKLEHRHTDDSKVTLRPS